MRGLVIAVLLAGCAPTLRSADVAAVQADAQASGVRGDGLRAAQLALVGDWGRHVTVSIAVFADKAQAEVELDRLALADARRSTSSACGKAITGPNYFAQAKRW